MIIDNLTAVDRAVIKQNGHTSRDFKCYKKKKRKEDEITICNYNLQINFTIFFVFFFIFECLLFEIAAKEYVCQ